MSTDTDMDMDMDMGSQTMEEELQRILKASGIESSPIDPSSMQCLKQLLMVQDQKKKQQEKKQLKQNKKTKKKTKIPSFSPSKAKASRDPFGGQQEPNAKPAAAAAAAAFSSSASPTSSGALSNTDAAMIMEQLKMQTNLILSLQDKIQVLTRKVNEMDGIGTEPLLMDQQQHQQQQQQQQQQQGDARAGRVRIIRREVQYNIPPPGQAAAAAAARNGIFANQAAPAAVAGPQDFQPNVLAWFCETTRLFWSLSRDYVRPIDGALLFKLIFMTTVVMARITKKSKRNSSSKNSSNSNSSKDPKILMVSALLMMGFLFHTRYIQYVYQFFWKQNVPGRVWKGEQNITIPPPEHENENNGGWNQNENNNNNNARGNDPPRQPNPVPPRLRRRDNGGGGGRGGNEAAPPGLRWWQQNDLLLGGVAPHDAADPNNNNNNNNAPPAPVNPIVAVFHGIYYLVGSFVFSIFPMWNPQGHQQRRPLRQERLDDNGNNNNNNNDNGGNNNNNNHENEGRIPQVQAPRDAMQAADDDSDDGDDGDDEGAHQA
ncbi:MAG: hypothetical protein SGBAC_008585 [Bacillariaceae sp.]